MQCQEVCDTKSKQCIDVNCTARICTSHHTVELIYQPPELGIACTLILQLTGQCKNTISTTIIYFAVFTCNDLCTVTIPFLKYAKEFRLCKNNTQLYFQFLCRVVNFECSSRLNHSTGKWSVSFFESDNKRGISKIPKYLKARNSLRK